MSERVKSGLDRLGQAWPKKLNNARVGIVVHPASVTSSLSHASEIFLNSRKMRLSALFGPQHGIRGETQDNMIEWRGFRDSKTGIPVYSLYGETREPRPEMLNGTDVLVVDMQDVGARYYTFIWTLALVMKVCGNAGKALVVLDRPNPIGGTLIEGPTLNAEYGSFVGLHPLPVRHGLTIAEIAAYLREFFYPDVQLHIIRMQGWKRDMWFEDTSLPWVFPSPNMPTPDTAKVYPGMCLLEGTNISEGRGTTKPFEIFGAPFINPDKIVQSLAKFGLPGVVFRPMYFMPTFHKYVGLLCGGAQIHIADRMKFKPFLTAVAIIKAIRELAPGDFGWKEPPYEYEYTRLPFDILAGSDRVRKDIEGGITLRQMESWWKAQSREFDRRIRRNFLLYK